MFVERKNEILEEIVWGHLNKALCFYLKFGIEIEIEQLTEDETGPQHWPGQWFLKYDLKSSQTEVKIDKWGFY